jgi:hypothetical protein
MAKWIESTLAAMIWSWLMFLLMMKSAVREEHQLLAATARPVSRKRKHLKPGQILLNSHGARFKA